MSDDPARALTGFCEAWARRDKAMALTFAADGIAYNMTVPEETLPFGGLTVGRPAMSDRLQSLLDQFDTVSFDFALTVADREMARGQATFCFRHKVTGVEIDGVMRLIAWVRGGQMVSFDEFHDVDRVRAFMRLVAHAATVDQ